MAKAPEEGEIWEWRAFGPVDERLTSIVRSHPARLGILDQTERDLYLISDASDQNVKLRRWEDGWILKIKLLVSKGPQSIELYSESSTTLFRFPVTARQLGFSARLLGIQLNKAIEADSFTDEEFIDALESATPPAIKVEVAKLRSQFDFDGGWVELADVLFPGNRIQTVSIHSPNRERVEAILDSLRPGRKLEVMNYVEACRRWR